MKSHKLDSLHSKKDITGVVAEVSALISNMAGIVLNEKNYAMVENRLKSRMARLGIADPAEYLEYLNENLSLESNQLLSLLTTHHTYFFREFSHFEYLLTGGLAKIIQSAKSRGEKKIRVWSAAASRGQEVYSLAMFLDLHLRQLAPDMDFEVWGTDVDPQCIAIAKNGVYPYKELKQVPAQYLGQNWARGTGDISEFAKVKQRIREKCFFETYNLVTPGALPGGKKFDIIFCRNVFIYFTGEQIKKISTNLMNQIHPSGLFFIGVSESLGGLGLEVESVGPSIFTHKVAKAKVTTPVATAAAPALTPTPTAKATPEILRVLCVDDSSTILTLLGRVLRKETGFQVVATATNGREAMDALKHHKIDVMTLDIHMPEMDGLTYLKTNMNAHHPPVLMLSSVNRENADTALKSIELGASDYVEKPNMSNLEERGEEIRSKLKMAFYMKNAKTQVSLDTDFKRNFKVTKPGNDVRIVFASFGDKKKLNFLLKNSQKNDPGLVFVFDGANEALGPLAAEMEKTTSRKIELTCTTPLPGQIYFLELGSHRGALETWIKNLKSSLLVLGTPIAKFTQFILAQPKHHLFLEDLGPYSHQQAELLEVANARAPLTSYFSDTEEYFERSGAKK